MHGGVGLDLPDDWKAEAWKSFIAIHQSGNPTIHFHNFAAIFSIV